MARKRSRRLVVPEAEKGMELFKVQVMLKEGYAVNPSAPEDVKFAVARSLNIPLQQGNNGQLTTGSAGKVGGQIGGAMVREMVQIAKLKLIQNARREGQ